MVAQISIPVGNVASLLTLGFTRVEIWRTDGFVNEYAEITASSAAPATLTSNVASTTFRMGGKTLKLKKNGAGEQVITFSSVLQYWTPTQVVNRINEVVASLASVVSGAVKLTSNTTGRASTLEITYNDADDLGLPAGTSSTGRDVRISLSGGTYVYQYTDIAGTAGDSYKWRFSANGVNPISQFYGPIEGTDPPISAIPLSIGTANFTSLDGRAMKAKLLIAFDRPPLISGAYAVGSDRVLVVEADDQGFLQVPLVQGAIVRIAVEGTAYVREITVPSTATFDLFSAMSTAADPFTVQILPPFLIRRSLP